MNKDEKTRYMIMSLNEDQEQAFWNKVFKTQWR